MTKGTIVTHKSFGKGTVVGVSDDTVSVQFIGPNGRGVTRKFMTEMIYDDVLFPKALNAEAWKFRKPKGPGRQSP